MLTRNQLNIRRAQRWWGPEYKGHEYPPQIMLPLAYIVIGGMTAFLIALGVGSLLLTGVLLVPAPNLNR